MISRKSKLNRNALTTIEFNCASFDSGWGFRHNLCMAEHRHPKTMEMCF
jgi:hypothetical protein